MTDWTTVPADEFWVTFEEVNAEGNRRRILETAEQQQTTLNQSVLTAEGVKVGDEWRQPTGGHDAYPKGFTVTHDGKTWTSLVSSNVWAPGISGWREVAAPGQPPLAWIQPQGAHDAYQLGDRVSHNDQLWTSDIAANAWEPGVSGWVPDLIEGIQQWKQPVGATDAYVLGAKVTHKDRVWESEVSGNVWEPGAFGWKDLGPIVPVEEPEIPEESNAYPGPNANIDVIKEWVAGTPDFEGWQDEVSTEAKPVSPEELARAIEAYTEELSGQNRTTLLGWLENIPGVEGEVTDPGEDEWPAWVQPVGAGDAYALGAKVSHDGKNWTSTADANVWVPGVYGWVEA